MSESATSAQHQKSVFGGDSAAQFVREATGEGLNIRRKHRARVTILETENVAVHQLFEFIFNQDGALYIVAQNEQPIMHIKNTLMAIKNIRPHEHGLPEKQEMCLPLVNIEQLISYVKSARREFETQEELQRMHIEFAAAAIDNAERMANSLLAEAGIEIK